MSTSGSAAPKWRQQGGRFPLPREGEPGSRPLPTPCVALWARGSGHSPGDRDFLSPCLSGLERPCPEGHQDLPFSPVFALLSFKAVPGFWGLGGADGCTSLSVLSVLDRCRGRALVGARPPRGAGGAVKNQGRAGVGQLFPPGSSQRVGTGPSPVSSTSAPGASLHPAHGCCWGAPSPSAAPATVGGDGGGRAMPGTPSCGPVMTQDEGGGGKRPHNPRMGFLTASGTSAVCQGILSWLQGDAVCCVAGG